MNFGHVHSKAPCNHTHQTLVLESCLVIVVELKWHIYMFMYIKRAISVSNQRQHINTATHECLHEHRPRCGCKGDLFFKLSLLGFVCDSTISCLPSIRTWIFIERRRSFRAVPTRAVCRYHVHTTLVVGILYSFFMLYMQRAQSATYRYPFQELAHRAPAVLTCCMIAEVQ